mmetsp:Transcript_30660/g.85525  ORF Transcript_30660/g.85525 Transcript_30660/m.85525 type:complete len:228 (-) Transcript_30660:158-841(-)
MVAMIGCCGCMVGEGGGAAAAVTTDANKEVDVIGWTMDTDEESIALPAIADPNVIPALPEHTFTAKLQRDYTRQPLGLSVEQFVPDALYVSKVDEDGTAAGAYNASAPEDQRLQAGLYIVSVDSLLGASAVDSLVHLEEATIVLKRPKVFEVAFARNGLVLGIVMQYDSLGTSVYVRGIEDVGAAKAAAADLRVGDRIVSVNGVRGYSAALMEELKSEDVVLAVSRP